MYVSSASPIPMNSETPLPPSIRARWYRELSLINFEANRAKRAVGCTGTPSSFYDQGPIVQAQVASAQSQIQASGVYQTGAPTPEQRARWTQGRRKGTQQDYAAPIVVPMSGAEAAQNDCGPSGYRAPVQKRSGKRKTATLPQSAPNPKPLSAPEAASSVATAAAAGAGGAGLITAAGDVNAAVGAAGVTSGTTSLATIFPIAGLAGYAPQWGDAYVLSGKPVSAFQSFVSSLSSNPIVLGLLVIAGAMGAGAALDVKKGRR